MPNLTLDVNFVTVKNLQKTIPHVESRKTSNILEELKGSFDVEKMQIYFDFFINDCSRISKQNSLARDPRKIFASELQRITSFRLTSSAICKDFTSPPCYSRQPRFISSDLPAGTGRYQCTQCYLSPRQFPRQRGSVSRSADSTLCVLHSPSLCLKTNAARYTVRRATRKLSNSTSGFPR